MTYTSRTRREKPKIVLPKCTSIIDRIILSSFRVETGCWNWLLDRDKDGYGKIRLFKKNRMAHRASYEAFRSNIPAGMQIDHLCRNPRCVNPMHLEPVTSWENTMRGTAPSSINARKTECPLGHPYSKLNTYISNGRRICKMCSADRQRVNRRNKRAI